MNRLLAVFIDNWKFSILLTLIIACTGALSLALLNRETLPPVNFARVSIRVIYPGASPEEVQDKVTSPIEEELRGISGIRDIRSVSMSEQSEIGVRIDIDNGDTVSIVNEIQRAVQRASSSLPPEIHDAPTVTEIKARELPVLELALVGPNGGRRRDALADRLKEIMEDVKGVSRVSLTGYRKRQLQVLLDRRKLSDLQVGLSGITQALSSHILNIPAGRVGDEKAVELVRVMGRVSAPEEVGKIVVRANDLGHAVRLSDLGRVVDGSEDPRVLARLNGSEATLLVAAKSEDADSLEVIGKLRLAVERFKKELPPGYSLEVYRDEGVQIANRLGIVTFNAVAGLVIVLAVLFLFLPGRMGVASAFSLPVCALGTIALMVALGANFNVITMIALVICLGNLVDNSVVITEHYARLRERGTGAREAAVSAAKQFAAPFAASTVTIVAAFLPMLVTKGVMGQFIRWIPIVVMIALTLSLVEALTLLPARLQFFSPKSTAPALPSGGEGGFARIEKRFASLVSFTLEKRKAAYALLTALIALSLLVTVLFNRFELFPSEGVEYYVGRFEAPPGTSIYRTDLLAKDLAEKAAAALGREKVASVVSQAGAQNLGVGDAQARFGEQVGILLIQVKPELAPELDVDEMLGRLRAIHSPAGVTSLAFSSIRPGPPVGKPLTVTFRSSDHAQLGKMSRAFMEKLKAVPGVLNADDDVEATGTEHRVTVNGTIAAMAQTSVASIGMQLRTALQGIPVSKLSENGKEYDVVVKFDARDRSSFDAVRKAQVMIFRDMLMPLANLARFSKGEAPPTIRNYNHMRSVTVTADADTGTITSARLNMLARGMVAELGANYPAVSAVFGGEEEATRESLLSLGLALLLAVLGIFATLVLTFRSYSRPLLILSTVPLGIIGVLLAFAATGRPLSFMAFVGVVGLSGVVINSAIILVDHIDELRAAEPGTPLPEILVRASTGRLRAVLATGLTTVVGLVPTAFGLGGYDPILAPLTLALSWGMIIGTVLSLVWLPTGYLIFERLGGKRP